MQGSGGIYDVESDSDGRWSAEKFRGLMFQIDREANVIAKETRRGKGNFIICYLRRCLGSLDVWLLELDPNT